MDNDRLQRRFSRTVTKWSRHQLPGWWTACQVLIGVGFFGYLAFSLISPDEPRPTVALPPASSPAPVDPATPSPTAPVGTPDPTTAPTTATTGSGTATVLGPDGSKVTVPAAAAAVATASFHALYDPKAAAGLPVVNGQSVPGPGVAFPRHTVKDLQLVSPDPDAARLVFQAQVDPDGPGPLRGDVVARTVELTGEAWQFNPAG